MYTPYTFAELDVVRKLGRKGTTYDEILEQLQDISPVERDRLSVRKLVQRLRKSGWEIDIRRPKPKPRQPMRSGSNTYWDSDTDDMLLDWVDNEGWSIESFARDTLRDVEMCRKRYRELKAQGRECRWNEYKRKKQAERTRIGAGSLWRYAAQTRKAKT